MSLRYIPSIAKSLLTVMQKMKVKDDVHGAAPANSSGKRKQSEITPSASASTASGSSKHSKIFRSLADGSMSLDGLSALLLKGVDKFESDAVLHSSFTGDDSAAAGGGAGGVGGSGPRVSLFLVPTKTILAEEYPLPSQDDTAGGIDGFGGSAALTKQNSTASETFYSTDLNSSSFVSGGQPSGSHWASSLSQMSDLSQTQPQSAPMDEVLDLTGGDELVRADSGSSRLKRGGSRDSRQSAAKKEVQQSAAMRWIRLATTTIATETEESAPTTSLGYVLVNC